MAAASRASILLNKSKFSVEAITAIVDEDLCKKCGLCAKVCPFGAIQPGEAYAIKCDRCPDRPEGEFACVIACPTGALYAATPKEHKKIVREKKEGAIVELSRESETEL